MYINPQTFRQWWDIFHTDYPLMEVRLIGTDERGRKSIVSGYYDDCESALAAMQDYRGNYAAYSPFNLIRTSCRGKVQYGSLLDKVDNTTSGDDIDGILWLFIDLDPERAAATNATDEEVAEARRVMISIGTYLRDKGFSAPVVAMSGNGYHMYYRVNLKPCPENDKLIEKLLYGLNVWFSSDKCKVDQQVKDRNRLAKITGSKSNKGRHTKERPQRESYFIKVPEVIQPTKVELIKAVIADLVPEREQPSRYNRYNSEPFDLDSFLSKYGIEVHSRKPYQGGEKIVLEHCPFNHEHKAPDSALFVMSSGAIGFKCLHNSCSDYGWKDFRLHFDPQAYDRKEYEAYQEKRSRYEEKPAPVIMEESETKGKKWKSMSEIKWIDPASLTYIPTGFTEVDRKIRGLALGEVSLISGLAGSGKSSIINMLMLNALNHGFKAAIWSGELTDVRFQSWIDQAAAGRQFVKRAIGADDYFYCPKNVADKVNKWLDGRIWLYNNDYGNRLSQLLSDITECIKTNGTQLIVLDNLMSLELDSFSGEKNDRERKLMTSLTSLAKQLKIHIILVVHPRKEMLSQLLRMESISGSSDLYNAADNVFLLHRVNIDFERRASEFFGTERTNELKMYHEVFEIAKNRMFLGIMSYVVGLYFERASRRYLNTENEYTVYGWQDIEEQQQIALTPSAEFNTPGPPEDMPEF